MEENHTAGGDATTASVVDETTQVSTEKKSETGDETSLKEEAKIQSNATESGEETTERKKEEEEPFHKSARFQRMLRKTSQQGAIIEKQERQIEAMNEMLKEVLATAKGEDYVPPTKTEEIPSPDELLESEMDAFTDSLKDDLTTEEESEIIEIAKKFKYKAGDRDIYLPPEVAYQIK